MKRDYPRMATWQDFGQQLLRTGDLDPLYYVSEIGMEQDQLKRFLLAYWLYYSAGIASSISEVPNEKFFDKVLSLYKTAPRGHERRHFRGEAGIKSIKSLMAWSNNNPIEIVDYMTCLHNPKRSVRDIIENVTQFYMFGQWIAWKISDMTERVLKLPVDFSNANLLIYSEPKKATGLILLGDPEADVTEAMLNSLVRKMEKRFRSFDAPPDYSRKINVQEVETIMCKYKAHVNGHYPLFNDTIEILEGLEGQGRTAEEIGVVIQKRVKEITYEKQRHFEW